VPDIAENRAPAGGGLSGRDFRRLAELIESECGIVFSPAKRTMIETRLGRRVRALGLGSLAAYCAYLATAEGLRAERVHLVDAVTTHETSFFREAAHFEYLARRAVPELARQYGSGNARPFLAWSAACSTGEEPYSMAMTLSQYAAAGPGARFRFSIEATDVSTGVLEKAREAVYPGADAAALGALRKRYLLRSREPGRDLVRVAPEIRALVRFRPLNLMDSDYGFREPLDVVFCRNVMIYFQRPAQQRVLRRIVSTLRKGGYLFMGHAESLAGFDLPLEQVAPTVHRRRHG
jgi:chemotaxis protein methyltransferase CheR